MPSHRLSETTVSLNTFDVVGSDGDEAGFISHVGLTASPGSQHADSIPVFEMGPPLHVSGELNASVVGCATLTDDEVQKIKTFIDRHANEHFLFRSLGGLPLIKTASQMYCIYPHAMPFRESDGRYARMRFSCGGFVFEAYKKARIKLLDLTTLPMIDFAVISSGYPVHARLIANGRIHAEDLGLSGDGPWPVLLCGYLFHALNRNQDSVRQEPYAPCAGDRYFI